MKSSGARVACVLALGCSDESVPPRAQTLLFIDTNAPLVGQLTENPSLSRVVAVDTLRIDRLDEQGEPVETQEIVAPDARDWPISFGVVASETVRFRVRAFRAENARASETGALAPLRNLSLDRLIALEPTSALERKLLTLDVECFNAPASFTGRWSSCLDAEHLSVSPREGLDSLDTAPLTRAGTTPLGESHDCADEPPRSAVCIPGGLGVLGDEQVSLLAVDASEASTPSRVLQESPFFLDRTEVTVGQFRAALSAGLDAEAPALPDDQLPFRGSCTYLGQKVATNDDLPVNCVTHAAARAYCQWAGGDLPRESQWEFAARGRDRAWQFVWGLAHPVCCSASVERADPDGPAIACPGAGLENVGSHADATACSPIDESRDGALDLGGSVKEWVLDTFRSYDHPCWSTRGILRNPLCQDPDVTAYSARGSYYNASFPTLIAARRGFGAPGPSTGFRCAYPSRSER